MAGDMSAGAGGDEADFELAAFGPVGFEELREDDALAREISSGDGAVRSPIDEDYDVDHSEHEADDDSGDESISARRTSFALASNDADQLPTTYAGGHDIDPRLGGNPFTGNGMNASLPYANSHSDRVSVNGEDFDGYLSENGVPVIDGDEYYYGDEIEDGDGMRAMDEYYSDAEDDYSEDEEDFDGLQSAASPASAGDGPYFAHASPRLQHDDGDSAISTPAPAKSAMAEILERQQARAQDYWGGTNTLGFGETSPAAKRRRTARHPTSTPSTFDAASMQGAPTANPYLHLPPEALLSQYGMDPVQEAIEEALEAEPPSTDHVDEGRGGAKRGRGRPRGRRGIAWALAGTSHDPKLRRAEERAKRGDRRRKEFGGGSTRIGSRRSGRPLGGHKPVDPGPEFKHFQTRAVSAMLDADYEKALNFAQLAVKANPEVPSAHSVLSNVLRQLGREEDSIGALISAAVIQRNPDVWITAADRTLELANHQNLPNAIEQALWCYTHAFNIAKNEPAVLAARAGARDMHIQRGEFLHAKAHCKTILGMRPHDLENLRINAELSAQLKDTVDIQRARVAYETAFEAKKAEPAPTEPEDIADIWSHINIYLELVDRCKDPTNGIRMLKSLARWVLGRGDETFWDSHADANDLEFDVGHERRAYIGEFQQGKASREKERYGEGLPLELRVKLGLFRINLGMSHHEEAFRHLNLLLELGENEVREYFDLFFGVADTLRRARVYKEALKCYVKIRGLVEGANEDFLFGMAECFVATQGYGDAEDIYRTVIRADQSNIQARIRLAKLYERTGLKDEALPLIKEVIALGRKDVIRRESLPLPQTQRKSRTIAPKPWPLAVSTPASQLSTVRKIAAAPASVPAKPFASGDATVRQRPLAPATLPASSALSAFWSKDWNISTAHKKLEVLWPEVQSRRKDAMDAWIDIAANMVEAFREERAFYPLKNAENRNIMARFTGYGRRRWLSTADELRATYVEDEARRMIERLEPEGMTQEVDVNGRRVHKRMLPTDFQGVQFGDWHKLISNLVLLYADRGAQAKCYDVLQDVLTKANVFWYEDQYWRTSNAVALSCALAFNDSDFATDIARDFVSRSNFVASMPYQLVAGVTRLCHSDENALYAGRTQKFMARAVKTLDYIAMPLELRNRIEWGNQSSAHASRLEKVDPSQRRLDAGVLTIFGNVMSTTQSANASLPYYLRALAVEPDNPSTNLCVGLSYISTAMKRSTENRHYQIQEGLSFVQRYYDLRIVSGQACHVQEAEYNMAKTWHMLGLMHLAIPGFEKVLALSEQVQAEKVDPMEEVEDFAKEAAFALQQMFAIAGNDEAAQAITEQWLVI